MGDFERTGRAVVSAASFKGVITSTVIGIKNTSPRLQYRNGRSRKIG